METQKNCTTNFKKFLKNLLLVAKCCCGWKKLR